MLQSITLEEFKSWKKATIPLGGVTVFIGPSDEGKSSLAQALRAVAYNAGSKRYIRWGASKAKVALTILTKQGTVGVLWTRDDASNAYVLAVGDQHKKFTKIGKDVPQEIQSLLEVWPVRYDKDTTYNLNFRSQFSEPFLMGDTAGATVTKVISSLAGLHPIHVAIRNVNLDILGETRRLTQLKADLERTNVDLSRFGANWPSIYASAQASFERKRTLDTGRQRLDAIKGHVQRYKAAQATLARLSGLNIPQITLPADTYSAPKYANTLRSGWVERIKEHQENIDATDRDIQKLAQDRKTLEKDNPTCPVCNRPWETGMTLC